MKQFKLATLAAAGLLATGLAGAGTLQVTPIQYAAETIVSGTALTAPVFSYALAAPISVSSSPVFDFDFELDNALWDKVLYPAGVAGNTFYIVSQDGVFSLKATSISYPTGGGDKVLRLRFNMVAGGLAGFVGATPAANYTFPVGSNVVIGTTLAPPSVVGTAAMVAPANSCTPADANTILRVNMYDALAANTPETAAGSAINFVQQNTYLRSSSGLAVNAATAGALETSRIDVTNPSLGRFFTNDADLGGTAANVNEVAIARIRFTDRGTFKDAAVGATGNYTVATGFAAVGGATPALGNVSVNKLNLRVTGAFNTAGFVYMSTMASCLDAIDVATGVPAAVATNVAPVAGALATNFTASSATFTGLQITAAGFPTATPTAYVCYKRDVTVASSVIPPSQFALDPTVSNVTHTAESGSPVCGANLYNLRQNGVQMDLRNVVAKTSPAYTEGWRSFVRIINTDESQTAVVTGQVITSAGTVLAGKTLITLAPRAYKFMDTDEIETALTGSASAAYSAADGQNYRLRLTSPTSSIRAQNWLLNPATKNFVEASGAQGDEQPGTAATAAAVTEDSRK